MPPLDPSVRADGEEGGRRRYSRIASFGGSHPQRTSHRRLFSAEDAGPAFALFGASSSRDPGETRPLTLVFISRHVRARLQADPKRWAGLRAGPPREGQSEEVPLTARHRPSPHADFLRWRARATGVPSVVSRPGRDLSRPESACLEFPRERRRATPVRPLSAPSRCVSWGEASFGLDRRVSARFRGGRRLPGCHGPTSAIQTVETKTRIPCALGVSIGRALGHDANASCEDPR